MIANKMCKMNIKSLIQHPDNFNNSKSHLIYTDFHQVDAKENKYNVLHCFFILDVLKMLANNEFDHFLKKYKVKSSKAIKTFILHK